jgi:hypothetical protein
VRGGPRVTRVTDSGAGRCVCVCGEAGWGDLDLFYSRERAGWDWTYAFMPPPHAPSQPRTPAAEATVAAWPPPPVSPLQWVRQPSITVGCRLYEASFPTVVPRALHDALPLESRCALPI